ncbi:MAG: tRNA (N(6)-L-threonylcarbamoyladenosine(37)-C(2))-methylthiotransferase MtaB [Chloroflexi bacterium]|nr:tRNA (N(6)-L-threonylcarbamoyladenosine(37)-C(2))-methylthiotransferase MtaB [Chloroflexota bacterium]
MKVALDTLGCKVNQAEAEFLARQLAEAGYSLVSLVDEADVYILNTCTVTHTADSKSRRLLRAAHRRNPDARLVVTGCYAQRVPQELAQIEGVSLVIDNGEKPHLLRLLQECGGLSRLTSIPGGQASHYHPVLRTRAFIKVQDGCNSFCAYCIVPLVRGRGHSLPVDRVVAEVSRRVAEGYQEVVLTGTEVGSYHHNGVSLKGLLEHILAETNITRLRLSSLQPQEISPELIGLWRDRRLCPHFHLSLQSGSDAVLQRMKRGYCVSEYQEAVALIRTLVLNVAITTDIIVGFPGETGEEFEESYQLCRQLQFARIHVFPYSQRNGTEAARLPHQISAQVQKERRQKILALAETSARNFRQQFSGKVRPVLWEKQSAGGVWSGLTDRRGWGGRGS